MQSGAKLTRSAAGRTRGSIFPPTFSELPHFFAADPTPHPHMKLQNLIFQVGGILLVAGAIMPIFPRFAAIAAPCFAVGALCFAGMQMLQRYDGPDVTLRRLFRQQKLGALLVIVSAALMILPQHYHGILRGDEWKVTLAVAAVLEIYTAFRIPHELEKPE